MTDYDEFANPERYLREQDEENDRYIWRTARNFDEARELTHSNTPPPGTFYTPRTAPLCEEGADSDISGMLSEDERFLEEQKAEIEAENAAVRAAENAGPAWDEDPHEAAAMMDFERELMALRPEPDEDLGKHEPDGAPEPSEEEIAELQLGCESWPHCRLAAPPEQKLLGCSTECKGFVRAQDPPDEEVPF